MLDLGQRASVWIATSFHQLPRVHKHANAWSTHCLPGLMSPAREQTMISGTGELRLTGWNRKLKKGQPCGLMLQRTSTWKL